MEVKSTDGVSIAYEVAGSSKPTLLFVHGWCCNQSHWNAQVTNLAPRYKVVTLDLAGHGKSGLDRKNWTMESFSDDVLAVIEELDLDQVVLIGHSMGGEVIAWVEPRIPQRIIGLIGVDTYENIEHVYTKEQVNKLLAPFQVNFPEAMYGLVKSMFMPDSNSVLVEKVTADMAAVLPGVGLEIARAFMEPKLNLAQVLEKVKAPIHCIASDRNTIDVEVALRHVSSFEVSYMSDVGHFVMIEDPDTFNRLINEIVKELIS